MSLKTTTKAPTHGSQQVHQDAFIAALVLNDHTTVRRLIATGTIADVNTVKDKNGRSLWFYVQETATAAFLLLECKAGANARDAFSETPLFHAVRHDHGILCIARLLLDNGADVSARGGKYDRTPLHYAATAEVARLLIERGASVYALDKFHRTPLFTTVPFAILIQLKC